LNKSAIARAKRIAWNTVHRWLEKAADLCRRFDDRRTTGFTVAELQADEIRSIVGGKPQPIGIFAAIEVRTPAMQAGIAARRLMFCEIFSSTTVS
jgi:hypothetical protein